LLIFSILRLSVVDYNCLCKKLEEEFASKSFSIEKILLVIVWASLWWKSFISRETTMEITKYRYNFLWKFF